MADGDTQQQTRARDRHRSRPEWPWLLLAVAILSVATGFMLHDVLSKGGVAVSRHRVAMPIAQADVTFEAWLVARNAYTLMRQPHRIFDTEHCAPDTDTLTLGIPMITMGLLSAPVSLVSGDPVFLYNFAIAAMTMIAGLAMYLLVAEWTRCPAAGIVASLLYAFNPSRTVDIHHPSVWDTSWLVLSIYFAQRLFAYGRWRDAIGLGIACSLQIGASFYPLLASALLTPPYLVWLICRDRFRNISAAQIACVLALVLLATIGWLGPYLDARASPTAAHRDTFAYADRVSYLMGGMLFPGYAALLLGLAGIFAPRARATAGIGGDPRWVLIGSSIFVMVVAAGENTQVITEWLVSDPSFHLPDLYGLLARIIPGLDAVRGVLRLVAAAQVVLCILAGMGAAWLITGSGSRAPLTIAALLLMAWVSVLGLPVIGIKPPHARWDVVQVDADPEAIAFYRALANKGNRGPILELPARYPKLLEPARILLAAYHHRRTSACYGSYDGMSESKLIRIADRLPNPKAVRDIRRLGFTTLVVHHPGKPYLPDEQVEWAMRFATRVRRQRVKTLRLLHRTPKLSAYEILADPR